jgi:hypothetical protein
MVMFPAPKQVIPGTKALMPRLKGHEFTPPGVPYDEYKALRETTLYAGLPPGGLTPEVEAEWVRTGTGIFRTDNNEFPRQFGALLDPVKSVGVARANLAGKSRPRNIAGLIVGLSRWHSNMRGRRNN